METRRLQYFIQIVDSGSINRAAGLIGIAQPALSQQIAILEHELKTRLLDRSSSGVTPTNAGKALYARAQVIVRQVANLQADLVAPAGEVAGTVALGLPPSHGLALGEAILARTLRDLPRLRLHIVEAGAVALSEQLERGLLDLAISAVRNQNPDVRADPLFQEDLMLISAPNVGPMPSDLAAIAALPWIVSASPNAIRGQLGALFAHGDLTPNVVAEVNSLPLVVRAVEAGLGVTLLPRGAVVEALDAGRLHASPIAGTTARRTVYLCAQRTVQPTAATQAIRAIVEAVAADFRASL
ncbi:nitrogen assimilation transcriptional regulator NAC [soil metagenome]